MSHYAFSTMLFQPNFMILNWLEPRREKTDNLSFKIIKMRSLRPSKCSKATWYSPTQSFELSQKAIQTAPSQSWFYMLSLLSLLYHIYWSYLMSWNPTFWNRLKATVPRQFALHPSHCELINNSSINANSV